MAPWHQQKHSSTFHSSISLGTEDPSEQDHKCSRSRAQLRSSNQIHPTTGLQCQHWEFKERKKTRCPPEQYTLHRHLLNQFLSWRTFHTSRIIKQYIIESSCKHGLIHVYERTKLTCPLFPILPVTFNSALEILGTIPGIEPPVARQLQNALAKYLFASSLCKVMAHPSPFVAFPPLNTVPFKVLISAFAPVVVALDPARIGCPGSWVSVRASWLVGMRLKVDWLPLGVGRVPPVMFEGRARRACRMM